MTMAVERANPQRMMTEGMATKRTPTSRAGKVEIGAVAVPDSPPPWGFPDSSSTAETEGRAAGGLSIASGARRKKIPMERWMKGIIEKR